MNSIQKPWLIVSYKNGKRSTREILDAFDNTIEANTMRKEYQLAYGPSFDITVEKNLNYKKEAQNDSN